MQFEGVAIMAGEWQVLSFCVVGPASFVGSFVWLQKTIQSRGLLPAYLPKSLPNLVFRCLGIAAIPLVLMSVAVFFADLLYREDNKFRRTQVNSLTNTLEQSLLFSLNLLAFSTLPMATSERLVILALFFVFGRLLFWLGYNLFFLTEWVFWKAPGMAMTLAVQCTLLYYNLEGIVSK